MLAVPKDLLEFQLALRSCVQQDHFQRRRNRLVAHKNGELIGTQVSLWAPQACLVSSDGLNINKFNCKKMLVKKAKSTRTSDFSMFLYMLILNFCFLQSLKSFLGEDKLKVSLCGVFIFFH